MNLQPQNNNRYATRKNHKNFTAAGPCRSHNPRGRSGSRIGAVRTGYASPQGRDRCISVIHAARRTSAASASDVTALRNSMDRASSFLQSTGTPGMPWKRTEGRSASKVERKCVHLRAPSPLQSRGRRMGVEGGFQYPARGGHFCHCHQPKMSIIPRRPHSGTPRYKKGG